MEGCRLADLHPGQAGRKVRCWRLRRITAQQQHHFIALTAMYQREGRHRVRSRSPVTRDSAIHLHAPSAFAVGGWLLTPLCGRIGFWPASWIESGAGQENEPPLPLGCEKRSE